MDRKVLRHIDHGEHYDFPVMGFGYGSGQVHQWFDMIRIVDGDEDSITVLRDYLWLGHVEHLGHLPFG